jgi:MFS family permease
MSPTELRASLALAAVYGLRLFGMFVLLPIFVLYTQGRPGWTLQLAGVALGIYGLTQASLQVPYGLLSDRYGRKPLIYAGLSVFAAGSFLCAWAEAPWLVILGRAVQGAGAISAVTIALAADLTRDSQRSKSMAIIGSAIGGAFALSFVAAPFLQSTIGLPGIFVMIGICCFLAMAMVAWVVPDVPPNTQPRERPNFGLVLRSGVLARLNVGIFSMHVILMSLFVVLPTALVQAGLAAADHWRLYLPVVVASVVLMLPAFMGRLATRERLVFLGSISLLGVSLALLVAGSASLILISGALVIFFVAFNVLEAKLPALLSRSVPTGARGGATGVYSTVQYLGTFAGGVFGGVLAQYGGFAVVLAACLAVTAIWLAVAWKMGGFVPISSVREEPKLT